MPDCFDAFRLPLQHLESLSVCEATPQALSEWLVQQPLGKPRELSISLHTLLPEINQLNCDNSLRIELLDIVRPAIYQCINNTHERYLSQALQLDNEAKEMTKVSHTLLCHLCDGYLIAIKHALARGHQQNDMVKCFFFALHGLGQLYFHCAQLYTNPFPLFWIKAHSLYQLASDRDIANTPVPAYHSPDEHHTIAQAYKRLILLACSHTNRLAQVDIAYLHSAFEQWSSMIEVTKTTEDESLRKSHYWVNLNQDNPPHNREQLKSEGDIAFDLSEIILLLKSHNHYAPSKSVKEIPTFFRHSLVAHLLQCWQHSEQRKQVRLTVDERLEVCIGLENAYLLLNQPQAHALKPLQVNAIDSSTDGLCLRWQKHIPKQTAPGECVLIRSQGKTLWRIGIIRWIHRINQYTYGGIQLLSGHVAPTAATLNWEHAGNRLSQLSIAFTNNHQDSGALDILLTDNLTDSIGVSQNFTLETQRGEEALLQIDKLADFASVYHYTCKITNTRPPAPN